MYPRCNQSPYYYLTRYNLTCTKSLICTHSVIPIPYSIQPNLYKVPDMYPRCNQSPYYYLTRYNLTCTKSLICTHFVISTHTITLLNYQYNLTCTKSLICTNSCYYLTRYLKLPAPVAEWLRTLIFHYHA